MSDSFHNVKINNLLKKQKSMNINLLREKSKDKLLPEKARKQKIASKKNLPNFYDLKIKNLTKNELKKFEAFLKDIKKKEEQGSSLVLQKS